MEKKLKLIEALEAERKLFYGRGQSTIEHDIALDYLKTGDVPSYIDKNNCYDEYPLLDAAINDLDCLISDYGDYKIN